MKLLSTCLLVNEFWVHLDTIHPTYLIGLFLFAPLSSAAAAAAKSRQSCPTPCDPTDGSPPGSRPWDSLGKNTGVGCHFLLQCVKVKSLSRVRLFETPWTVAYQAPLSTGFSRQEYWSGLPLPSPMVHNSKCWLKGIQNLHPSIYSIWSWIAYSLKRLSGAMS